MSTVRLSVPASGPAAGYPGHHASNPSLLPQLMEAAMNCVRDYVQVRRAERVLVVAELDTDPLVAGSLASAATLLGADVATITVPSFSAGGFDPETPGEILMGAFERADVVISCAYFEFAHSKKTFFDKLFSSRKRVCSLIMGATAGCMVTGGRFPIEIMQAIGDRAFRIFDGAKKVRYVTASGTDLTFEEPKGYTTIAPMKPGSWSIFPPMGINFYPENSNGVIVFDESTLHGRPAAPIRLHIENNHVAKIEAGARADLGTIEAFSNGRYYMRHSVVGLNPKTRMSNAPQFERERAAGTCYLGVDGTPGGKIDRSQPGHAHLDVIFDTPTVYVDDKMMVDRRKLLLLDDPTLHEVARKFGDPKRLLAQNPFLW
jgi:leucyl aminopeptidase (aminopeptidase T)